MRKKGKTIIKLTVPKPKKRMKGIVDLRKRKAGAHSARKKPYVPPPDEEWD